MEEKEVRIVEKVPKVFRMADGSHVEEWCMGKFSDLVTNVETVYDIFDVYTNLIRLEVTKNNEGLVTDVIAIFPRIDETTINFAMKNFLEFHELSKENDLLEEDVMISRRHKLQKWINKMNDISVEDIE